MTKSFLKKWGPTFAFVNAPSKLQPYHKLHGKKCLATYGTKGVRTVRVYFTDDQTSMEMDPLYLSSVGQ